MVTLFGGESPFGGVVTLDTGMLYKPKENLQLDVELNVGGGLLDGCYIQHWSTADAYK